jgi:two-component system, OmpR family, response regulator
MVRKVIFINNANPASIIPEILAGAGYEITETSDPETGLRHLESQTHDLVILMENAAVESWTLCARIRHRTLSPFIVISSGAGAESCVMAINAGADFFIRKSFGPMEFLARINALFQRVSSRQPTPVVSC